MRTTARLMVAALAAAGLAMSAEALAQEAKHGGNWSGSHRGSGSGNWSGTHRGGSHWNGVHRGAYVRHGGHWGGHWGGYRSHWYGPRFAFSFGVPVVIGAGLWGYPYWDGYWGPRETVVYREVIREEDWRDGEREAAPAPAPAESRPAERAPNAGPLYMNYCESSRRYYPDVTSCPEGWKFVTPTS
ncbi:MAG TPA: hypothetical protein VFK48_10795 [Usitatibacter sp.]|nr:hypothetical protein [Usitatibacter sp.]